jgi:tetratricopeptide (TPR) repeat protein
MKIRLEIKVLFISLLIGLLFINFKAVRSSYFQAFLLYDFNADEYNVPYKQFQDNIDVNIPNLTHTGLPIKALKARSLMNIDSIEQAKIILYEAINDNPFLKLPENMLAKIYLEEGKLDSAYFYSKQAFYEMKNANPHRYTYFRVLEKMNKSKELDSAFTIIKDNSRVRDWYDYIYTKFKLNIEDETLPTLIEDFKKEFSDEDVSTINEIERFITIGSEAYTLATALSALGDERFANKDYTGATDFYEKAIGYNNKVYLYYENAAISYDLSNNYEKALEYYNIVLNNFKTTDGKSDFYKGLMLIKNEKFEEGCLNLSASSQKRYVAEDSKISAFNVFNGLCLNKPNN